MKKFSEKIFLTITPPTEEDPTSNQQKIRQALSDHGYHNIKFPLKVLQNLYSVCQKADYHITVTLVYCEENWTITSIEPGDTRDVHYGLAVDYGSTTIIMQIINLNTGEVIAQAKEMNGQIAYGTDILTRITYTMQDPAHMEDLQKSTTETFDRLLHRLTLET